MTLHKTNEVYINLKQENRSFVLTVAKIQDYIDELCEKYDEDSIVSWEWIDRGHQMFSIGLGDIDYGFAKVEIITYLTSLLEVHRDEIESCDYIHFRNL